MGVYAKEFYDIMQRKKRKIDIKNVMVTSATLSCVAVSVTSMMIERYGFEGTFTLLFLIGCSSNKFIKMIFDGSLLKILYKFLGKSKDSLQSSIEETLNEEKDDKKDKKKKE
jgi:hypothetical protein